MRGGGGGKRVLNGILSGGARDSGEQFLRGAERICEVGSLLFGVGGLLPRAAKFVNLFYFPPQGGGRNELPDAPVVI